MEEWVALKVEGGEGDYSGKVIVVAEDDKHSREMVTHAFSGKGPTIYEARNGQEALQLVQSLSRVDCVISDLGMPVVDGLELYRKLQDMGYTGGFLFVSGFTEDGSLERVRAMGLPYLQKPPNPVDVIREVDLILNPPDP